MNIDMFKSEEREKVKIAVDILRRNDKTILTLNVACLKKDFFF